MQRKPTVLFAGGGTGGHLFPGIAVAEELGAVCPGLSVLFAGSEREIERKILAEYAYEHYPLPSEGSTSFYRAPLRLARSLWRSTSAARKLLRERQPACVVGLGGFASVPVAMAARRLRIPLVLLEQNIVPGRATRLLSPFAATVCLSFPETVGAVARRANARVTGNPVRRQIANLHGYEKVPSAESTLLILGGSQGAVGVNDFVLSTMEKFGLHLVGWRIVHQTGEKDEGRVRAAYRERHIDALVKPFFDDLPALYRSGSLAISRAGATTLAELACAGCPAVLIPYPNSVGDHQLANARWFVKQRAATIIEQSEKSFVDDLRVSNSLHQVLAETQRNEMRKAMRSLARPHAAREVADCVAQYIR